MWYEDLCDYYGVTPRQAVELAGGNERRSDRRPDLPALPTTHAVSGKTRTKNRLSSRQAQERCPAVFEYIRTNYALIKGPDPDTPNDDGIRCWQKT
jgi:hypothetical protein